MLEKLIQIFKIKDLRKKIFYTLGLLVIFRIAAQIPIPSVDAEALKQIFEGNQFLGLLDVFSGGGLRNFSIVAMGVAPYITATIIMQLLGMIIPALEKLQKEEGEEGRRKINQYTRYLAVPMAMLQSYGMIRLLSSKAPGILGELDLFTWVTTIVSLTAGTMFLMWIGELITENGIGNGISLIIFAGIVSQVPRTIQETIINFNPAELMNLILFGAIAVVVIAGVVFITEGQRNIPISYARRVRGHRMYGGAATHLPLRVNQAGVIPIIFAISVMLLPGMLANFFVGSSVGWLAGFADKLVEIFNNQLFYAGLYFIMVILFTYFYTSVTFDPKNIAKNIQRQGGFIPGIRPGENTAEYLHKTMNRVTLVGAIFLGVVAILPYIIQPITKNPSLVLGGTGLLIVVSVVIETVKQVESQMVMRDYEEF